VLRGTKPYLIRTRTKPCCRPYDSWDRAFSLELGAQTYICHSLAHGFASGHRAMHTTFFHKGLLELGTQSHRCKAMFTGYWHQASLELRVQTSTPCLLLISADPCLEAKTTYFYKALLELAARSHRHKTIFTDYWHKVLLQLDAQSHRHKAIFTTYWHEAFLSGTKPHFSPAGEKPCSERSRFGTQPRSCTVQSPLCKKAQNDQHNISLQSIIRYSLAQSVS